MFRSLRHFEIAGIGAAHTDLGTAGGAMKQGERFGHGSIYQHDKKAFSDSTEEDFISFHPS
jgi:hypothetical protein